MSILICISSKSPNPLLYECIDMLYKIQIKDDTNYKVCVVDSDSDDFSYYDKVKQNFPNVEIHFIKNKNYEYGAWKYIHEIYPDVNTYFCIQDSNIINKYINLEIINDNNVYTFHHYSGYNSHYCIKQLGIDYLKESDLNYESIIDTNFTLAQHSIFIVNNKIMKEIFISLTKPPINKESSCVYERNFGLFFIIKNINTHDLNEYIIKYNGNRF
jgi:hypothetical protein